MSSALRIALIAHNHFPIREPFAGGIEAHIWHLTRALVHRGHRVTLYAAEDSDVGLDHPGLTVRTLRRSTVASAPFPLPGAVKESDHYAFVELMATLARNAADYDVIHNHSLHYVPILLASRVRTPVLTTLHTPPFPLLEAAIGAVRGAGLTFAAVSRPAAAAWAHVGINRMALLPNGIDTSRWPAGPGGRYLVWSGRLTREKGPHLAIEAAARAGWRLVLAGPIVDRDFFRRKIRPHLGDRVGYAGHLGHQDLAALVGGAAAALVTPLWDEPYGLVAAEAMSCGTPVVAFARGGIAELVDQHTGRLVAPRDVAAMADAIPAVLGFDREMVRHAAIARHSLSTMVANCVALYRRIVDQSEELVAAS